MSGDPPWSSKKSQVRYDRTLRYIKSLEKRVLQKEEKLILIEEAVKRLLLQAGLPNFTVLEE